MTEQPPVDITQDDKLFAALCYALSPLMPIIVMFMEDKKERPFIKAHLMQSLATGIVVSILMALLQVTIIAACLSPFLWLGMLYYAYKAFQGEVFDVPVVSGFINK